MKTVFGHDPNTVEYIKFSTDEYAEFLLLLFPEFRERRGAYSITVTFTACSPLAPLPTSNSTA